MTFYQVFLPPPSLAPLTLPVADRTNTYQELKFLTLSSSSDASQNLSQSQSLRNRLNRNDTTWTELSQAGLESLERSTVLGKRYERNDQLEEEQIVDHGADGSSRRENDTTVNEEVRDEESILQEAVLGKVEGARVIARDFEERRVSNRITRQSVSLLHTLPQIYPSAPQKESQEASIDTLSSTTSSFPSQLLTNPGNTSVSNLPRWSIPLHKLTSLSSLLTSTSTSKRINSRLNKLHSVIVCVLSTEPVVQRQRKVEKAKGKEGSLFIGKWIITAQPLANEDEVTSIVRLWDGSAQEWGEKVRRGDVILLENIEVKSSTSKEPIHLSVSPHHSPKITILYRTLPRYETSHKDYIYRPRLQIGAETKGRMLLEDKMLRPDLRLGRSEAGIRKVEGISRWFANFVEGESPT